MNNKFDFLLYALKSVILQNRNCPYCKSDKTTKISSRKGIIDLRKCDDCGLRFRFPKESINYNKTFYQSNYEEGITTNYPDLDLLNEWKNVNFIGTPRDFSDKIGVLKLFVNSGACLDFGCSWGYGTYQLKEAGFIAEGYELSVPRAGYGIKNMGLTIHTDIDKLIKSGKKYDIIFSSHVIEHCPDLNVIFSYFENLLNQNGLLFFFVPNCNDNRKTEIFGYGMNHLYAFDKDFFEKQLPKYKFSITDFYSAPYKITPDFEEFKEVNKLTGEELLVVARKN